MNRGSLALLALVWLGAGCSDPPAGDNSSDAGEFPQDDGPDASEQDASEPDASPDPEPACQPLDCEDFVTCEGEGCPVLSEYRQVIPSEALPAETPTQNANNNLDAVAYKGRVFIAWRTAPYHFADRNTELFVVSTEDHQTYRFEGRFFMETDLREMRFLVLGDKLLMYYAVLGTNPIAFEPQGMMVTEYLGPDDWTEPEYFYGEGFIPWRTKVIDGVPYMIAYEGGENIYEIDGEPIRVHWLTTEDGREWTPVVPDQPVVLEGGSSETDFVIMDEGAIVAVSRNEAGDEAFGWGSKICRAEPESPGDWRCVSDPRKYDSPLLFRQGAEIVLIARRNVTDTGNYDLGEGDTPAERTSKNLIAYSGKPKRCALWRVHPTELSVTHVLDLPSKGDTCFPAIVRQSDTSVLVYNYTSPIEGDDLSWIAGQGGPTLIYSILLSF